MELSQDRSAQRYGLLYPLMLIAAIAVIVFSIVGIASIAGWMPTALSGSPSVEQSAAGERAERTLPVTARSGAAFDCAECRMIETIREFERSQSPANLRVAAEPAPHA